VSGDYQDEMNIRIYNSLSDVVYEQENLRINGNYNQSISLDVQPGIYYLKIEGENLNMIEKIVVNK
jgi:hypothetical protein